MSVKAGKICGNPTDGLCSRMVIETTRVFDGCATRRQNVTINIHLNAPTTNPDAVISVVATGARFVNYSVTPISACKSRLDGDFVTEYTVAYIDGGVSQVQKAYVSEHKSVTLSFPIGAIVPYRIKAQAVVQINTVSFINNETVSVTGCTLQIIKVVADVDILIPVYNYCCYPPCDEVTCSQVFNGDIFPYIEDT